MSTSGQYFLRLLVFHFLCFAGSSSLIAADYYVNDDATGSSTGADWANAYTSLQTALGAATSGDNIYVAAGTYYPTVFGRNVSFQIPDGVKVYGGYNASGVPGARGGVSILSGDIGVSSDNSDNSYTVVFIRDAGASTLLDGFTITAANADGSTLTQNSSGGGIYIDASASTTCSPVIQDCIIISNAVTDNGGGIYVGAEASGAVASPTIQGCIIANNTASNGAGVYNVGNSGSIGTRIISCELTSNSAMVTGGGVYNFASASTGLVETEAINSIFRNNSGSSAGGFYSLTSADATADCSLVNCVFYGNTANTGAAVYVNETGPDVGAGLSGSTTITTITNSIFWNSAGGFSPHFHFSETNGGTPEILLSYSIVDAANCAALRPGGGTLTCGTGVLFNQDPLFVNAGLDFNLVSGSPAINAGDNGTINGTGVGTDFEGDTRIQVGFVDLGAYETAFSLLPVELASFQVRPYEESAAILLWRTASELNNDHFTVEHSINGLDFQSIEVLPGFGTTNIPNNYTFIDRTPSKGINYYRLKQTDYDGTTTYSEVRTFELQEGETTAVVFPNPVEDVLNVYLGSTVPERELQYTIYDWSGRAIVTGILQSANGNAQIKLESTLPLNTGMYVLKIEGIESGMKFTKK